jgi:hypothetical protein
MAKAMRRRVRWTREQATSALESWRASGLSLAAFATREGLGYERLRRWQAKLADDARLQFAAVEVSRAAGNDSIKIELRCGIRLTTSERVGPEAVSRLVRALERSAC